MLAQGYDLFKLKLDDTFSYKDLNKMAGESHGLIL